MKCNDDELSKNTTICLFYNIDIIKVNAILVIKDEIRIKKQNKGVFIKA